MINKRDYIAEAMEAFWKSEKAPTKNMMNEKEAMSTMESEGMSIREKIESGVADAGDFYPDQELSKKYDISKSMPVNTNPFDLGGLDAMVQRELERERQAIKTSGSLFNFNIEGNSKSSYINPFEKELISLQMGEIRDRLNRNARQRKLEYLKQRMELAAASQQIRDMQRTRSIINRILKEDATRARFLTGLPVYESPLDYFFGGKVKKKRYDPERKIYEESIERTGGVVGAIKEGIDIYKKASPYIEKGIKDTINTLNTIGASAVSSVGKTVKFTKKAADEFASDAKGVFQVAKTKINDGFKFIDITVNSFGEPSVKDLRDLGAPTEKEAKIVNDVMTKKSSTDSSKKEVKDLRDV